MPRFLRPPVPMGQLARSTYLTSGWMAFRVGLQMVWMILIAHALGPRGYGLLAGITALATTLGTLTGIGFGVLLLQDASREIESFPTAWSRAIFMSIVTGIVLCAAYTVFAPSMASAAAGYGFFLAVGIAELICFPITNIASYAFQSHERMGLAGFLYASIPIGNLIAFGLFYWWSPTKGLAGYLPFHAAMAIAAALGSIGMVQGLLSPAPAKHVPTLRDIREGSAFSVMRLADTAINTLDKTFVLNIAGSHPSGIYSAAYRLISVATLPLVSLSMSVLPRLFKAGANHEATTPLVRKLLLAVLIYGVSAGVGIWLLAPLLPALLGVGFGETVELARWMSISPLLQGLYIVGANLLVTQKRVKLRVFAQILTLIVMILGAMILIPRFGLAGAAGMLLVTQASAAILIWCCYAYGMRGFTPGSALRPNA